MPHLFIFGDSLTHGAWDVDCGGWVQRLKQVIDQYQTSNFEFWCPVYNLGVSGDTSLGLLNRFENELNSRIQDTAEEPIIIFAIGTNDASLVKNKEKVTLIDYEKNLTELIKLSKKYTTKIVIVGLFPVDENLVNPVNWDNAASYLNTSLEAYNSSALKISRAYNLVFINLWEEVSKLDYSKLLYDGLHPNSQGHELIYNKVKKHLLTEQFLRIDL